MWPPARTLCVVLSLLCCARWAPAQDTVPPRPDSTRAYALPPVAVTGRADNLIGTAATASEGRVGSADLRLRPITREGELQETVPGVIVTQHSGDGKANQYFVRGFNLDHGTDFATSLEGMPLNMPTHAHGQGYTDLGFLIPELVDYLDYRLGVYHAEVGDFGSAGAAEYHLVRALDRPFATATTGANGMVRLAVAGSARMRDADLLLGGEAKGYDGPWDVPERLRKLSGVARYTAGRGASQLSVLGMAYHNQWNATDQIPLRAVQRGLIDRFGQIDPTDGGTTGRYSISAAWQHSGSRSAQAAQVFAIRSTLSLYSDFEYRLSDTTDGDQFGQRERRVVFGGSARQLQQLQALGAAHLVTLGMQTRYDILSPVGLYHTVARAVRDTVRQDDVRELAAGVFAEARSTWSSRFRTVLGFRGDAYTFAVTSGLPANSGNRGAAIASPKVSLAFTPSPAIELYLSGGLGFHSNDARGTTITVDPGTGLPVQRVDPLVRSRGAELGVRATPRAGWRSMLAVWILKLNSELLFTGDGGTTQPSAASRRRGVTWANFYRPIPRLSLDADVSLARARFGGVAPGADHIPGALENVIAAGIAWNGAPRGPYGSLRFRHFGAYPLVEDNTVRASPANLVNAAAGYSRSGVRVEVSVLNLLNEVANDIAYYYTSRLAGEPAGGVDDIHFHPVEPRQIRVSFGWGR